MKLFCGIWWRGLEENPYSIATHKITALKLNTQNYCLQISDSSSTASFRAPLLRCVCLCTFSSIETLHAPVTHPTWEEANCTLDSSGFSKILMVVSQTNLRQVRSCRQVVLICSHRLGLGRKNLSLEGSLNTVALRRWVLKKNSNSDLSTCFKQYSCKDMSTAFPASLYWLNIT
jgi:hypothetical protein